MLLKKSFLLDFVGGEPFLLKMEQYPAFGGYCPALMQKQSVRYFLFCMTIHKRISFHSRIIQSADILPKCSVESEWDHLRRQYHSRL
jgi:hypothetical protein